MLLFIRFNVPRSALDLSAAHLPAAITLLRRDTLTEMISELLFERKQRRDLLIQYDTHFIFSCVIMKKNKVVVPRSDSDRRAIIARTSFNAPAIRANSRRRAGEREEGGGPLRASRCWMLLRHRFDDESRSILDLALAQNHADVILDRSFGELEFLADFGVAFAFDNQRENLVLALAEFCAP